jgi:hypothetical protein
LNPLSYPATSQVDHDRADPPESPPSISTTAGSLRRNGEGNVSRSRRSGAYSANSIPYRAMPGRSIQWMATGRSPNRSITVTWSIARLAYSIRVGSPSSPRTALSSCTSVSSSTPS